MDTVCDTKQVAVETCALMTSWSAYQLQQLCTMARVDVLNIFRISSLTVILIITVGSVPPVTSSYRRVCYHTNWAQYRQGAAKFTPAHIPAHLCSHLVYAFATLNGSRLGAFEWNDEAQQGVTGMYAAFNSIKLRHPHIKTLLAVGGWNFGVRKMTAMLREGRTRSEFARSSVAFLRNRTFDGLDLDFEYPAHRGSPGADRGRFTQLVVELRSAFEDEARRTGRPRLLLSAAVAGGKRIIDVGYDVSAISRHLDMLNVMTYDFHGKWDNRTGHNCPLYAHNKERPPDSTLNLAYGASYWRHLGAPAEKLNIGLPLYGRTFTLLKASESHLGAPTRGGGSPAQYTREEGYMAFYEVCEMIKKGASVYWLNDQQVPYAVLGDQWLGFDDTKSLKIKVQWIKEEGFGGVMVWALDLDDFTGSCGGEKFPLLTAIGLELGEGVTPPRDVTQDVISSRRVASKLTLLDASPRHHSIPGLQLGEQNLIRQQRIENEYGIDNEEEKEEEEDEQDPETLRHPRLSSKQALLYKSNPLPSLRRAELSNSHTNAIWRGVGLNDEEELM